MYDLIIRNGDVYDGYGDAPVRLDVGIKGDRITTMGKIEDESAELVIDAAGLTVCPGFIDIHSHADLAVLDEPSSSAKILQGVTTEVVGNCGMSASPASAQHIKQMRDYISPTLGRLTEDTVWTSVGDYFRSLELKGVAVNIAPYIGHGTLRIAAMGFSDAKASEQDMSKMKDLLEEGLAAGARGISFGLIYAPGCFADHAEIRELVRTAASHGKMSNFHMRNESNLLLESVQQVIGYAEDTGAHVHISHLKASGQKNWWQMERVLELVEEANGKGLWVTCDQYPYTAGSTTITALMPQWALEGGVEKLLQRLSSPSERRKIADSYEHGIEGWDSIVRENGYPNIVVNSVEDPELRKFEGKSITAISSEEGKDEFTALLDFIVMCRGNASIVVIQQSEENVELQMRSEYVVIGSDGLHVGRLPHPRLYGTFPRVLGRYVRDRKVISLAEAICKMTSNTARILGIHDRGLLEPGKHADIVIFDPATVADKASYENPRVAPCGIESVIVNGKPAVGRGQLTGVRNGRCLRS